MEIKANEQEKKALVAIKAQTTKITSQFDSLTIKNQKDLGLATEALSKVNKFEKEVKMQEKEITEPIKEGLNKAKEFFKPLKDRLAFLKGELKMKIMDYSELIERKKDEKEKEVTEKIKNGEMSIEQAGRKLEKIEVKSKSIPTRTLQKIKITNEKLIPQKYWELNMILIRKEALAGTKIPGVKVVEEKIIVAQSNG